MPLQLSYEESVGQNICQLTKVTIGYIQCFLQPGISSWVSGWSSLTYYW